MNKKAREAKREIKKRSRINRIKCRWRKYGCSCGHHNMRGDR